jgi:ArsR family transcriptional regulator, arsenate/arsenite/antimonite-responsive transcriptional repressor
MVGMSPNQADGGAPAESAVQAPERVKGCSQPVADPLPEARAEQLATFCRALADPTRIQMIHILAAASEPVCVCDFTAAFDLGQPTVSHHLAKLRDAGLVTSFKQGIWAFYQLNPATSEAVCAAMALLP